MEPVAFGEAFSLRRTLSHGMLAIRVAAGPMWLGGLLMMIGDGCNSGDPSGLMDLAKGARDDADALLRALPRGSDALLAAAASASDRAFELPDGWGAFALGAAIAFLLFVLVIWALLLALGCWVTTGFVRLHVGILEREEDSLSPLFSGRDRFWSMLGYKSLVGLALSGVFFATVWPGAMVAAYGYVIEREVWMIGGAGLALLLALPAVVWVGLGTFLGELAVALDGMPAFPALRRSFQLASGNRFSMLWFVTVCWFVQVASVIGLLACCVGALATMPLARSLVGFAKTEAYLLFTRGRAQTAGFKLWRRAAGEAEQDAREPAPPAVAVPLEGPASPTPPASPPATPPASPPTSADSPPPTWQPDDDDPTPRKR